MVQVTVDKDLEDLIPGFLANRRRDIEKVEAQLANGDFDGIRIVGHSMKGSGGGYGFPFITEIGAGLERAAIARDADIIRDAISQLRRYLAQVEIVYR
jgi:HPt (histidine-containing phosphotransfer) domain-containing protein